MYQYGGMKVNILKFIFCIIRLTVYTNSFQWLAIRKLGWEEWVGTRNWLIRHQTLMEQGSKQLNKEQQQKQWISHASLSAQTVFGKVLVAHKTVWARNLQPWFASKIWITIKPGFIRVLVKIFYLLSLISMGTQTLPGIRAELAG